jgi:cytochrome c
MFKLDHKKLLQLGLIATLSSTAAFSAPVFLGSSEAENGNYSGEKIAIDGGMVYPRKNGSYTA